MKKVEGLDNYNPKDYNYVTLDYEIIEDIPDDGYFLHFKKEENDNEIILYFAPLCENIEDLLYVAFKEKWPNKNIRFEYGNIPLGFSNIQHFLKDAGFFERQKKS